MIAGKPCALIRTGNEAFGTPVLALAPGVHVPFPVSDFSSLVILLRQAFFPVLESAPAHVIVRRGVMCFYKSEGSPHIVWSRYALLPCQLRLVAARIHGYRRLVFARQPHQQAPKYPVFFHLPKVTRFRLSPKKERVISPKGNDSPALEVRKGFIVQTCSASQTVPAIRCSRCCC